MVEVTDLMSLESPVFKAWIFYAAVLVLKMLAMSPLTAKQRFAKMVFANPEDTRGLKKASVKFDDPDVERVRRAHLNDLENILPYFVASYVYLLTNPTAFIAINLFRAFTVLRIVHTLSYTIFSAQPYRAISWGLGFAITIYMAVMALIFAL